MVSSLLLVSFQARLPFKFTLVSDHQKILSTLMSHLSDSAVGRLRLVRGSSLAEHRHLLQGHVGVHLEALRGAHHRGGVVSVVVGPPVAAPGGGTGVHMTVAVGAAASAAAGAAAAGELAVGRGVATSPGALVRTHVHVLHVQISRRHLSGLHLGI